MRILSVAGWKYIEHMFDREEFKESVARDLAKLDETPANTEPTHKPEFGFFDPPV
jgi:hypothetical protein